MEREKLTEEERQRLALAGSGSGFDYIPSEEIAKALRIIDAQAAAVLALDEQVAQLTAERNEARGRVKTLAARITTCGDGLSAVESENARLTEQVAQLTELAIAWEDDPLVPELRAENARLTEALAAAEQALAEKLSASYWNGKAAQAVSEANTRAEAAERDRDAANRLLVRAKGQLQAFAHTTISRAALMTDLDAHLSSQPAAPLRCSPDPFGGCRVHGQPAAPTRTEGNYSLAELRRIIRAEPGSLTGAELVVRDAMLEMCTSRAGAELTALRRRVARATAALTRNHVARALEALRGL